MDQSGNNYLTIDTPKRSDWSMTSANITWTPKEGCEPNWFHRKMQELCFGFKWRKNTK